MSSMSSPPNYHEREAPEHLDEMTCMLYRAATRTHTRAGSLRAHAGLRHLPHVAARDGPRIASAHARHAGRRRARARRARRRFPERVHRSMQWIWMVVFGPRSHRRVRHLHRLY